MFAVALTACLYTVYVCAGSNPLELESMRDALEEAQRWNASLQARLGQIQNRGGGVGQANDSGTYTYHICIIWPFLNLIS